jgi:hypothetical protein
LDERHRRSVLAGHIVAVPLTDDDSLSWLKVLDQVADSENLSGCRLLAGLLGDDESALCLRELLVAPDEDPVSEGFYL